MDVEVQPYCSKNWDYDSGNEGLTWSLWAHHSEWDVVCDALHSADLIYL